MFVLVGSFFHSQKEVQFPVAWMGEEKFWAFNDIKLLQQETKRGADRTQDENRWGETSARKLITFPFLCNFSSQLCSDRILFMWIKNLIYCAKFCSLSAFLVGFFLSIYCAALTLALENVLDERRLNFSARTTLVSLLSMALTCIWVVTESDSAIEVW